MFRGLIVALAGTLAALVYGSTTHAAYVDMSLPVPIPTTRPVPSPTPVSAASVPAARTLATPAWARMHKQRAKAAQEHATNRKFVAEVNRANRRLDFVMYGDSITAFHIHDPSVWKKHFGGLDAAPLAMSGSTTDELAWRMMEGGETPRRDPRVVAFMIGINDLKSARKDPAPNLDYIVRWTKAAWPSSQIYVVALLPNAFEKQNGFNVAATNKKYRDIARRHGAAFLDCGSALDPRDKKVFSDGTHPTTRGQDKVLTCLRRGMGL